jgi:hypothetical protein
MKITVGQLKRIIRETLDEMAVRYMSDDEAYGRGRFDPNTDEYGQTPEDENARVDRGFGLGGGREHTGMIRGRQNGRARRSPDRR